MLSLCALCAKRRHRVLVTNVSLPMLVTLSRNTSCKRAVDSLLRALGFSHGVNDIALCHSDYALMQEWFELTRSLAAQTRIEKRMIRKTRRAWEANAVSEKWRAIR